MARRGPEARTRDAVVKYARDRYAGKVLVRKQATTGFMGNTGDPDDEFNWINGHTEFVEFKSERGVCTPKQLQRHAELRALGYTVTVVNCRVKGKDLVDVMYRRACRKAQRGTG